jgi:CPA2 family monovalent cation:H+ antiporter-2
MEYTSVNFLLSLGLITLVLFIVGLIGKFLKFPTIILFIFIGIIFGRYVHEDKTLEHLSEIGIVLLFFYLGLEFNIARAIDVAKRIWVVGFIDLFFNFFVPVIVLNILGFEFLVSILGGAITYASSSAITSKIIVDEKRIANPETEMILGLMVFEDIIAPIMLAVLAGFLSGQNIEGIAIGIIALKISAVFSFVFLISIKFKNQLALLIDKILNEDLFILFAFGSLITFAGLTYSLDLSEALGAFLIGMLISETGKSEEVEKSMLSIRDLAVAIFFFLFGANTVLDEKLLDIKTILALIILIVISTVGKFLTGYLGGKIYGLSKRASITAGFSIINRGEFSIVISKLSPAAYLSFFGVYIFFMALIGILFAQYAPKLSKLILKPKQDKPKMLSNFN